MIVLGVNTTAKEGQNLYFHPFTIGAHDGPGYVSGEGWVIQGSERVALEVSLSVSVTLLHVCYL